MDATWWALGLFGLAVGVLLATRWVLRRPVPDGCRLDAGEDRCPYCSPPVTPAEVAQRAREINEYFDNGGVQ